MYLWRNVMRYVAPKGRIVAMDNIGFGKSEQPEDLDYTFQTHYDYVEKFIQQQKLKKVTLVIHDWGLVLGLNYAMLNSKNVRGLVFMETIVPPKFPMDSVAEFGPAASMFEQFRNPETGKQVLIEQNTFIEKIMVNASFKRTTLKRSGEVLLIRWSGCPS